MGLLRRDLGPIATADRWESSKGHFQPPSMTSFFRFKEHLHTLLLEGKVCHPLETKCTSLRWFRVHVQGVVSRIRC